MPSEVRFHLDEHVSHDVARALASRGISVTTPAEAGLLGASDEAHLTYALRESRVVVTHDVDFLRLARSGTQHSGIVFCAQESRSTGEIVRFLCLIHDCLAAEEAAGTIEYL